MLCNLEEPPKSAEFGKALDTFFFWKAFVLLKHFRVSAAHSLHYVHMPDLKYITETAVQLNHYLVYPSIHQGHLKNKGIIKMKYKKLF